jgi:hypothetical protein
MREPDMTEVVLDQATVARLLPLKESLALYDESGQFLGCFMPASARSLYEGVEVPVSEEELQRAEQDPESYTTTEVLAYLENLPCSRSDGSA